MGQYVAGRAGTAGHARWGACAALLSVLLVSCSGTSTHQPAAGERVAVATYSPAYGRTMTIRNDRGGSLIEYAVRVKEAEDARQRVRFAGTCESACTLFLRLPPGATCITPGASFGFHLPYGSSRRANRQAAAYLLSSYPGWVRDWIEAKGGLSDITKTMGYDYASRFMRPCHTPRLASYDY